MAPSPDNDTRETGSKGACMGMPHSTTSLPGLTRQSIVLKRVLRRWMDAGVKPAHDETRIPYGARFPDAVQRVALAKRCAAEPGPLRTQVFGTIPVLRSSTACCIAPGKQSAVEYRHRPRPPRRGALDLHRKARHHEPGRRQLLQIVQLFDVAIADVAAGLVAFPDQAG